jgi:hypothetical protein
MRERMMNPMKRLLGEYEALNRVLGKRDLLAFVLAVAENAREVLRSRNLASVDAAMSRHISAHYRNRHLEFPLPEMDRLLTPYGDSYSFGGIREMYAHDCYLKGLHLTGPVGNVLDLGANRGMFSLLAAAVLGARLVVGVEPNIQYDAAVQHLLSANHIGADRVVRYHCLITSPTAERQAPDRNISIDTICTRRGIERIALVKIDIEGGEKDLFSEPEWLARVDNIAMELHARFVGDLSVIPYALRKYGFEYRFTSISGETCEVNEAMYLYGSRTGALQGEPCSGDSRSCTTGV